MMDVVRKYMKSGKKPKEAIAMAIGDKHMMKMAKGGIVMDDEDENEPTEMAIMGGGLPKDESMAEMSSMGADSQMRDLPEIQEDGDMNPAGVANPAQLAKAFMHAYAMGGLVQGDTAEQTRLHGSRPEEKMNYSTEEPMSSEPGKPTAGWKNPVAGGPALSMEAMEALKMKKKGRRFGMYNPQA